MNASEAAKALNELGARKGGHSRAARLTPQQRSDSARIAARARWAKHHTSNSTAVTGDST